MEIGKVNSYWDMCSEEGASLQRGMNYRLHKTKNVILMSVRKNAPYADRIEENGRVLIYEGHDVPKKLSATPKVVNQEMYEENKKLAQNGKFYEAAKRFKDGKQDAEIIKVYEKIRPNIWTYNGLFQLTDAWIEKTNSRNVFKFKLELIANQQSENKVTEIEHTRLIPSAVKLEVWERDKGQCVLCGSKNNLHYDHDLPFSKGGSSLTAKNVRILCAKCNLKKHDKIE